MGFVPKRTVYKLVDWPDPNMEGLEVKLRGLNTGQVLDLGEKKDAALAELDSDDTDAGDRVAVVALLTVMAEQMIEWNITEEDGTPVPPTLEGIKGQELAFVMAIVDAWQTAVAGVPDPLPAGSTSGEPSLVASIPTEALSPSPESSAVPA